METESIATLLMIFIIVAGIYLIMKSIDKNEKNKTAEPAGKPDHYHNELGAVLGTRSKRKSETEKDWPAKNRRAR